MYSKIALVLGFLAVVNAFKIPVGYNFGYDIQSADDANAREESRDADGNVKGFYMLRDADGRLRKVSYTAGKDGFNAQVESNEPGVLSKSSANVQVNGAELPKPEPATAAVGGGLSEADTAPTDSGLVPVGYDFGYDVQGETDSHSRKESSQNGVVRGSYSLTDSDGRTRKVTYTADENGFNAAIDTNEQGTADKSPANVEIRSPFKAPVPVEALPVNQVAVQQLDNAELSAPEHRQTIVHEQKPNLELSPTEVKIKSPAFAQSKLNEDLTQKPLYTSRSHSSVSYENAPFEQSQLPLDRPVLLPSAPLGQEQIKSTAQAEEEKYTSNVYSKINYSKAPTSQIREQAPLTQIREQAPLTQIREQAPLTQVREQAPLTQVREQAPLVQEKLATKSFAPEAKYTSNVYSKIDYAPAPREHVQEQVREQAPLTQIREQAPLTQIREQAPLTQVREQAPLTQVKTQAPLELPVYRTKIHSKINYAPREETLPVKSAPIAQEKSWSIKSAPIAQEKSWSIKSAPVAQTKSLPIKSAPIAQEKTWSTKSAPVAQTKSWSIKSAPVENKAVYRSRSFSNIKFESAPAQAEINQAPLVQEQVPYGQRKNF